MGPPFAHFEAAHLSVLQVPLHATLHVAASALLGVLGLLACKVSGSQALASTLNTTLASGEQHCGSWSQQGD